ncbi:MAG: phosphoribosylglycinamide formyltransferase [Spirochaetaceae bacterium]|nr:phosphoribosylglycinamide formyltransferase [Spirochaetaceae bacterium]
MSNLKLTVLVSGNGSNLHALIDAEKRGDLAGCRIAAAVADRPCHAIERAKTAGIPGYTLSKGNLSEQIMDIAGQNGTRLIVLAGFLSILTGKILEAYAGKIINLHPSLLPKFGGKGMYGTKVHQAVLAAGETESGCTVHLVNAGIDCGPILLQRRVPILPGDDPHTLAERIHQEEHIAIVEGTLMMRGL